MIFNFLKDIDIKNPSFLCEDGVVQYTPREPFDNFKDKCLLNFTNLVEKLKKDLNRSNDTDKKNH
jgi:hypothetical protein